MVEKSRSTELIPLSSPDVSDAERRCVLDVLARPTLSLGPMLVSFEKALARAAGTRHAVAVNSGTSALHLCVKAAELEPGDEVITTPFSFIASANCLLYENLVPRFVDICPETGNIDPALIPEAIGRRTRAILPVHVFGMPCDMGAIRRIATRNSLTVIEDACEAIGASIGGQKAGSFGHSAAFAFYPNKQITTGEGGAIVTDDRAVATLCRSWRNQGRADNGAWLQHERLGYNYRLSEINCALGLMQLSRLGGFLAQRRMVAQTYNQVMCQISELVLPPEPPPGTEMSWFVYVVRLRDEFSREDRDCLIQALRRAGIGCNTYFAPIHLQPFYRERFGFRPGDFPLAEHLSERTIALPFFNKLTEGQIAFVGSTLLRGVSSLIRRSKVFCA